MGIYVVGVCDTFYPFHIRLNCDKLRFIVCSIWRINDRKSGYKKLLDWTTAY